MHSPVFSHATPTQKFGLGIFFVKLFFAVSTGKLPTLRSPVFSFTRDSYAKFCLMRSPVFSFTRDSYALNFFLTDSCSVLLLITYYSLLITHTHYSLLLLITHSNYSLLLLLSQAPVQLQSRKCSGECSSLFQGV